MRDIRTPKRVHILSLSLFLPSESGIHELPGTFLGGTGDFEPLFEHALVFEAAAEVAVAEPGADVGDDDGRVRGEVGGEGAGEEDVED